ncbi:MAG: ComF family protein [Clostridiaceae bacterium]|nr:ComF family protein [Clostridiaceae bacterium]
MNIKKILANTFSPPVCIFCGKALSFTSDYYVCNDCALTLPYNDGKRCNICCAPLDMVSGDLCCIHCKTTKRWFAQNVSRYVYKDKVANAIKQMKFGKGQLWIADALGKFLAQTVKENYHNVLFDVVLSVPLSKKSLRERDFNQSELIANSVSAALGVQIRRDILIKPVEISKQSGLNFEKRKQNIKNAFLVKNDDFIIDKTILLVDDIYTTGATLNECSRVLRNAGASCVFCATVASTPLYR